MSKEVIRNNEGVITHVKALEGIFLSVKDEKKFRKHKIKEIEVDAFFGDDDRNTLKGELQLIANGGYDPKQLKYDIMSYNDLFNDKIHRE